MDDANQAYDLFRKSIEIDLNAEAGGGAEGIHIANCGGIWQSIIFGFARLCHSYEGSAPTLNPHLPDHWEKLSFPLCFKNVQYYITITKETCNVVKK